MEKRYRTKHFYFLHNSHRDQNHVMPRYRTKYFPRDILSIYVVPAHQTSDMSRCTILPESRLKLEMVILSSIRFLTVELFNMLITSSCVQISININ